MKLYDSLFSMRKKNDTSIGSLSMLPPISSPQALGSNLYPESHAFYSQAFSCEISAYKWILINFI